MKEIWNLEKTMRQDKWMDQRHVLEVNPTRFANRLDSGGREGDKVSGTNYTF